MSISSTTQPVLDQCVTYYDTFNKKSFVGPPITNLIQWMSPSGVAANVNWVSRTGTDTVYIPSLGNTSIKWYDVMNDYQNFYLGGGSGNCCPTLFNFGAATVLPSTLYTYAIVYKSTDTYTNANYMYKYEYTANGGTYVTEGGVHNAGNRIHLGEDWYWAWGTFTTQPTTTFLNGMAMFHYQYKLFTRMHVAKVLLVQGDYTKLHPKHWPDCGQTISQTQSLKDIATGNAINTSYMSISTSGSLYFSGTTSAGDILVLGTGNTFFPAYHISLEAWIKTPGLGSGQSTGGIFGITYGITAQVMNDGSLNFTVDDYLNAVFNSISTTGAPNLNNNQWRHIICTLDGYIANIYIDGVLNNTGVLPWWGKTRWPTNTAAIGRNMNNNTYYFNGEIPIARIYKKALMPEEVKQNYSHGKKRFGL